MSTLSRYSGLTFLHKTVKIKTREQICFATAIKGCRCGMRISEEEWHMAGFFSRIGSSFGKLWSAREGLSLRNIRPAKLYYAGSYTLALLLANLSFNYLYMDFRIGNIPANTLQYVCQITVSVAIMLLWSTRFKPLIRVSSAVLLIGLIPFLFLPPGIPKVIFACVAWAGLGGCQTAARCGFAFAANNAERLVCMFITTVVTGGYYFLQGLGVTNIFFTHILPMILGLGLVISQNLYRENEVVAVEETSPSDRRIVYFAMGYMIVYYATDAFVQAGTGTGLALLGLGYALSGILFAAILLLLKKSVWHVWNFFFALLILRSLLGVLPGQAALLVPERFLSGLSCIGMPVSLYMLGGVQKRYSSVSLLKKCTILLILFVPAAIISSDLLKAHAPQLLPWVTLGICLAVGVGFILATPASFKYLFSADWMEDFRKTDMTVLRDKVEQTDRFEHYGLTPREKEVAALLLAANTVRMIAGELKISQSTVNMHTANLYRKLGINSKAELFKKFGVAETETQAEG
ncbi:MAG: helix-turn-helix transcriptional regulator [Ruminococcaceae bacterium]|nr:helix-turn-helix transcriptional regulator [Oscillospiraceae bacterium]